MSHKVPNMFAHDEFLKILFDALTESLLLTGVRLSSLNLFFFQAVPHKTYALLLKTWQDGQILYDETQRNSILNYSPPKKHHL